MDNLQKIENLLTEKAIPYRIGEYSSHAKNANEAAIEMVVQPKQIVKSLVVKRNNEYVMFLLSIEDEIDVGRLKIEQNIIIDVKIHPEKITELTGYKLGLVTPFFTRTKLPVFIDTAVFENNTIGIASGVRGFEILLSPTDLLNLLSAKKEMLSDLLIQSD